MPSFFGREIDLTSPIAHLTMTQRWLRCVVDCCTQGFELANLLRQNLPIGQCATKNRLDLGGNNGLINKPHHICTSNNSITLWAWLQPPWTVDKTRVKTNLQIFQTTYGKDRRRMYTSTGFHEEVPFSFKRKKIAYEKHLGVGHVVVLTDALLFRACLFATVRWAPIVFSHTGPKNTSTQHQVSTKYHWCGLTYCVSRASWRAVLPLPVQWIIIFPTRKVFCPRYA